MTTYRDVETRLIEAVSVDISPAALRQLDARVAAVVAVGSPAPARRWPRHLLRPALVLGAFVLLTGAAAAALGLLDRVIEGSNQPGWRIAWERAEIVDLAATDAGVTITVERAYADLNQMLVGFTVAGLGDVPAGDAASIGWSVELRDPTGRPAEEWATSMSGMGMAETNLNALVATWEGAVSPVGGTWELVFSSIGHDGGGMVPGVCTVGATDPACLNPPAGGMVEGTWRFAFDLPAPTGRVITSPDVTATSAGVTLTLTELRVAPSTIAARIAVTTTENGTAQWWPTSASIRHGGAEYASNAQRVVHGSLGAEIEILTTGGSDLTSGTWEITIPQLADGTRADSPSTMEGPWSLSVVVP